MFGTDPGKRQGDSPTGAVPGVAVYGMTAALEEIEGGVFREDIEGAHLLQFPCHCCNSVNLLICRQTAEGRWLVHRAPVSTQTATFSAAGIVKQQVSSCCLKVVGDPSEKRGETACRDGLVGERGRQRGQDDPTMVAFRSASGRSRFRSSDSLCRRQGSIVSSPEGPRGASNSAAAGAATATAAIAAPAAKGERGRRLGELQPLATSCNVSSCSRESEDPRGGDKALSLSRGPSVLRAMSAESKPLAHVQKQQQRMQRLSADPQPTQRTKHHQQQQKHKHRQSERAASTPRQSGPSGGTQQHSTGKGLGCVNQQERPKCNISSTCKKGYGEVRTPEEGSPRPTWWEEPALQHQHQKQEQQQEEPEKPQCGADGVLERRAGGSDRSSSTSMSSRSNGRSGNNNRSTETRETAVAEIALHIVKRECEGDGNCLYRAFSDQLYGSQDHHLFLRWLAVEVMMRCKDTFEAFVDDSEGPFERWLQAKRTYGEWADYREMHALLLLFWTPIFVFDEHLQLLQAFEPGPEKRIPLSSETEALTPFRLMWHGRLGHYTSLHYVKERFPIARGLTIGKLEAEGIARLILSLASGDSGTDAAAAPASRDPDRASTGHEDDTLAECLQVSAQELENLAAEQELILAAIKKQRLHQLLPEAKRLVDDIWKEARKEQEAWTARLARGFRGAPLAASGRDVERKAVWRVKERELAATTRAAVAAECLAATVATPPRPSPDNNGPFPGVPGFPSSVVFAPRGPSGGKPLQAEEGGAHAAPWGENGRSQVVRYAAQLQVWQQKQQGPDAIAMTSSPVIRHSDGVSSSAVLSEATQALPGLGTSRGVAYGRPFAPPSEYVGQQRHCVRLADGRLMAVAPAGYLRPLRHATLQQQQVEQLLVLPAQAAANVPGQRPSGRSSSTKPTEETSWFMRWIGNSSNHQGS